MMIDNITHTGELAERHGVSIYAILQNPIVDPTNIDFVVTTEPAKYSQVKAFADDTMKQNFVKAEPVFFAFLWSDWLIHGGWWKKGDRKQQKNKAIKARRRIVASW